MDTATPSTCWAQSPGRDMDKMHESGLTPVFVDGQPTFARGGARADLPASAARARSHRGYPSSGDHDKNYANRDFHTMYIGEIVAAYQG